LRQKSEREERGREGERGRERREGERGKKLLQQISENLAKIIPKNEIFLISVKDRI
jgi:hypothetical protein